MVLFTFGPAELLGLIGRGVDMFQHLIAPFTKKDVRERCSIGQAHTHISHLASWRSAPFRKSDLGEMIVAGQRDKRGSQRAQKPLDFAALSLNTVFFQHPRSYAAWRAVNFKGGQYFTSAESSRPTFAPLLARGGPFCFPFPRASPILILSLFERGKIKRSASDFRILGHAARRSRDSQHLVWGKKSKFIRRPIFNEIIAPQTFRHIPEHFYLISDASTRPPSMRFP